MAGEGGNVAVAAMVVALVALLVTSGQLVQALFGTAVGYRHCQRSVIGGWVKWRRLKWHWREFRFETQFRTPHISLETIPRLPKSRKRKIQSQGISQHFRSGISFVTGTSRSRIDTCVYEADFRRDEDFLVGWLGLLNQIHVATDNSLCKSVSGHELKGDMDLSKIISDRVHDTDPDLDDDYLDVQRSRCTGPAIIHRRRSWDFMPPEIIRPFASSTVGDIIAIAHRLGMGWIDLRPEEGSMRAEGDGLTFTSTTVRGLGILLQFNSSYHFRHFFQPWRDFTIPCWEADALGFGIIKPCIHLSLGHLILDDEGDCVRTILGDLDINRKAIERFCNNVPQRGLQGLGDLISLAATFMPIEGLRVRKIMKVHRDFCPSHFNCWEGFHVFELRLEKLYRRGECSEQMAHLRAEFRRMKDTWKEHWTHPVQDPCYGNVVPEGYLEELHTLWHETTNYLRYPVHTSGSSSTFETLVSGHIFQAIEDPEMVDKADQDEAKQKKFGEGLNKSHSRRTAARMHLYIDRIPIMLEFVKASDDCCIREEYETFKESLVVDAWWTLIFRALCWHRAHYMIEGKTRGYGGIPVKSKFHDSKLPVYIV